jgi:hypothetical protein
LAVITWMAIILFYPFESIGKQFFFALILSVFSTITSSFIFLFPNLAFYLISYLLFIYGVKNLSVKKIAGMSVVLSIFLMIMLANWYGVILSISEAKSFSARILGTLHTQPIVSQSNYMLVKSTLLENLGILKLFYLHQPNKLLLLTISAILMLSVLIAKFKKTATLILFVTIFPIALEVVGQLSGITMLANYRWSVLWDMQILIFSCYLAYLLSLPQAKKYSAIMAIFLLSCSVLACYQLIRITMINFNHDGGMAVLNHYTSLSKLKDKSRGYRFVSTGKIRGVVPLFYNLDTFDGMVHNFPERRSYFVAYGLYNTQKRQLHTHRHFFYHLPDKIDLNMLAFANVKYLISDHSIKNTLLKQANYQSSLLLNQQNDYISNIFSQYVYNPTLLNSIYIYEIDKKIWPRLFITTSLTKSQYNYQDKRFYQQLKRQSFKSILIAKNDIEKLTSASSGESNLKIRDYKLTENGVLINLSTDKGILVFNQVYTPFWHAYCQKKKLSIIPVNAIMMAVEKPKGCKNLELKYQV